MLIAPIAELGEAGPEEMNQTAYELLRNKKLALETTLAWMTEQRLDQQAITYVLREVDRLGLKCHRYLECQKRLSEQATSN